jgi:hypothetical protein
LPAAKIPASPCHLYLFTAPNPKLPHRDWKNKLRLFLVRKPRRAGQISSTCFFRTINSNGRISNKRRTETLAHSDGRGQAEGERFARLDQPALTARENGAFSPPAERPGLRGRNFRMRRGEMVNFTPWIEIEMQ